jgi:hypothetical protein
MKYGDVLIKALAEVTGTPEADIKTMIDRSKTNMPAVRERLKRELSDEEVELLRSRIQKSKFGVFNWILEDALQIDD